MKNDITIQLQLSRRLIDEIFNFLSHPTQIDQEIYSSTCNFLPLNSMSDFLHCHLGSKC